MTKKYRHTYIHACILAEASSLWVRDQSFIYPLQHMGIIIFYNNIAFLHVAQHRQQNESQMGKSINTVGLYCRRVFCGSQPTDSFFSARNA